MKTIGILKPLIVILLVSVFAIGNCYADKVRVVPAKDVRQALKESIKYPSFAYKQGFQGSVDVVFTVGLDGQVCVKKVLTDNKEMAAYIEKEFGKVCCRDLKVPVNQHYKVTVTFRLVS